MNYVAKINLWGGMVGAVAWDDSRSCAVLEFDNKFIGRGLNIAPLIMPIEEVRNGNRVFSFPSLNKETFKGLPGLLSDSLPDKFGNRLIEIWLARQGRSVESFNSIERLCYTGKRGMGALEFEPALRDINDKPESIEIENMIKLTKQILSQKNELNINLDEEKEKGLLEIIRVGTSAGGARAKAVIAYNETTGDVKSGQLDALEGFDYWIIKFDGVADKQLVTPKGYGKIEYAYYLMAVDCGIKMSKCKLHKENKRAHFMTRRFDRENNTKLHMQTLCAIAHYDYNDPLSYSYEQAFQVMRRMKLPYTDMEQFYRRMVFNVVARNQDDHTKNISFLMDKEGNWRLSPAYDVTYAFDPKDKWLMAHQMSINGRRDNITRQDLLDTARSMNIKKASDIIDNSIEVISGWQKYGKAASVDDEQIKAIEKVLLLRI